MSANDVEDIDPEIWIGDNEKRAPNKSWKALFGMHRLDGDLRIEGDMVQGSLMNKESLSNLDREKIFHEWCKLPPIDDSKLSELFLKFNDPNLPITKDDWWKIWDSDRIVVCWGKLQAPESCALRLRKFIMDKNQDGKISEEEMKHTVSKQVEEFNNLLLNFGVVAALILSISFPFAIGPTYSDYNDMMLKKLMVSETVRLSVLGVLGHCFWLSATYVTFHAIRILQMSVLTYKQLNSWLPTIKSKWRFLQGEDGRSPIQDFVTVTQSQLVPGMIYMLVLGSALHVSLLAGLLAILVKRKFKDHQTRLFGLELKNGYILHRECHDVIASPKNNGAGMAFEKAVEDLGVKKELTEGNLTFEILKPLDVMMRLFAMKEAGIEPIGNRLRLNKAIDGT